MKRILKFKPSLRDMITASEKAQDYYAAMAGVKREPFRPLPPKRERKPNGASGKPLERDIQKAILAYLSSCENCVFAGRFNRGTAMTGDGNGIVRYTKFNTVRGFPDIHGMLRGGAAFYIEVKRAGGKLSDDQRDFIDAVSSHGGIAFVAESVDDVRERIK